MVPVVVGVVVGAARPGVPAVAQGPGSRLLPGREGVVVQLLDTVAHGGRAVPGCLGVPQRVGVAADTPGEEVVGRVPDAGTFRGEDGGGGGWGGTLVRHGAMACAFLNALLAHSVWADIQKDTDGAGIMHTTTTD